MNLFLRPLSDPNGVTWSVIWMLVMLLVGVSYIIVYILGIDEKEAKYLNEKVIDEENESEKTLSDL